MLEHANLVYEMAEDLYYSLYNLYTTYKSFYDYHDDVKRVETNCRLRFTETRVDLKGLKGQMRYIVSGNLRSWVEFFDFCKEFLCIRKGKEFIYCPIMYYIASDVRDKTSGVIDYIDQTIEEDKYLAVNYPTNGYPYEYKKENSTYRMFYFSEFITPDITGLCEEQLDELNWDFSTGGNDNKKSAEINAFLNYFFKLYDVYKRNDLPREIFDQAISDRLDKLVK